MAQAIDIPVSSIKRGPCERKYKQFESKFLGKGGFGDVYKLCEKETKDLCPYVLKAEKIVASQGDTEFATEDLFPTELAYRREVAIHQLAADNGLAPKIHDAWICERKVPKSGTASGIGFIVMDRLDGEIWELFMKGAPHKEYLDQVTKLVKSLHKLGVSHDDLTPQNVLYKREADGTVRFYLIDFGLSRFLKDSVPKGLEKRPKHDDMEDLAHLKTLLEGLTL